MSTELTVAVISAVVALVSILLSAKAARSTAMLQARLQDETAMLQARLQDESELRRKQADKAERLEQVEARYRDPLLSAAFELQSRIYNLVVGRFWEYIQHGTREEQDYAVRSTLFVVAQYLAWVEALKRGVQFLDLGDLRRNQDLASRLEAIRHAFATDQYAVPTFRIFRTDQRAIGEIMLESDSDDNGTDAQWQCTGYASFCSRLEHDQIFSRWFIRFEDDVRQLGSSIEPACPRLIDLQHSLVDLLNFLDESAVRFPADLRSKISPPKIDSTATDLRKWSAVDLGCWVRPHVGTTFIRGDGGAARRQRKPELEVLCAVDDSSPRLSEGTESAGAVPRPAGAADPARSVTVVLRKERCR